MPEIPTELGGIQEPPPRPQTAPKPPPRVATQAAVTKPGPASYTNARATMLAAPHPS
ncbi:MAG: hypothetical protein ABIU29_05945 [Chthoniobacterales bacterium]